MLWGSMFCGLAILLLGGGSCRRVIALAGLGAGMSECLKLAHFEWLDQIRRTAMGHFLMGQQFSWLNLAAYMIGISLAALATFTSILK